MLGVFGRILPKLEGMRTRVVCTCPFVRDLILLQVILPYFVNKRNILILYSEALYRKFIRFIDSILMSTPELESMLDKINIVKIGKNPNCKFGNLFAFIEQGNPKDEAYELTKILTELENDDVLIMHSSMGFFFELLGDASIREILEIFSILPDDITLIGFKSSERSVDVMINELYDIILKIRRDTMIDDTNFTISMETSGNVIREFGRFRIKDGTILEL